MHITIQSSIHELDWKTKQITKNSKRNIAPTCWWILDCFSVLHILGQE